MATLSLALLFGLKSEHRCAVCLVWCEAYNISTAQSIQLESVICQDSHTCRTLSAKILRMRADVGAAALCNAPSTVQRPNVRQ